MSKSKDPSVMKPVYEYMGQQNRPYSAVDIFNNLHKAYGKTAVVKALDSLVEEGKIKSKTYGKQIVYVVDQASLPEVSDAELKILDTKIQQTQEKVKGSEASYKKLDAELRSLSSSLGTKEAKERLDTVSAECVKHRSRISQLKYNPNAVSPDDRKKIMDERTLFVKAWRKRKRMATDMLNAILEGYPKSKKELYEEVGIETDEEYNVKPPDL